MRASIVRYKGGVKIKIIIPVINIGQQPLRPAIGKNGIIAVEAKLQLEPKATEGGGWNPVFLSRRLMTVLFRTTVIWQKSLKI